MACIKPTDSKTIPSALTAEMKIFSVLSQTHSVDFAFAFIVEFDEIINALQNSVDLSDANNSALYRQ